MRVRAAVVVAAAVALVVAACTSTAPPYSVGSFAWSGAVAGSRTSRVLTVSADVAGKDDLIGCAPQVVPHVTESPARVVVRVEVVNHPLPPNVSCSAVAVGALPATVHLAAPLGARRLVDEVDDRVHPVLVVDEQHTIAGVPAPFTRRATGWEESTGLVSTWWRWQAHGEAAQIDLDFGPPTALAPYGPPLGSRVEVHGVDGRLQRVVEGDTVSTTVAWTTSADHAVRLELIDQTRHPMTAAAVLALARAMTAP